MEESPAHGVDSAQVKKAVQALIAYQKTKEKGNKLLLNENEPILLMVTVWKIPNHPEVIRIPLPHGIRPDTCDVCLFTKDEPNLSSDQTEKFYKKLLAQYNITNISEVIPLKKLKTEYKPFEAKRRLLSSFDLFLADSRIRRLLPSQLGKHFYKEKREPQSVNLKAKRLAVELNRFIQGTQLHVTNKGCCYSIRMGHTGMKVEEIVENTLAVAHVLAEKLPMSWKNVKVLHLKTQKSVSLPIYNSQINVLTRAPKTEDDKLKKGEKKKKKNNKLLKKKKHTSPGPKGKPEQSPVKDPSDSAENDEEEIPELVPISEPAGTKSLGSNKTPEKIQASTPKQSGKKRKINEDANEETKTPSNNKRKGNKGPETPAQDIEMCNEEPKTPGRYIEESNAESKTPGRSKRKSMVEPKTPSNIVVEANEAPSTRGRSKKTPGRNKKDNQEIKTPGEDIEEAEDQIITNEDQVTEHEEQESPPKPGILRKTPAAARGKSARLTKSAKKAPVTPKLKRKTLKPPQSS